MQSMFALFAKFVSFRYYWVKYRILLFVLHSILCNKLKDQFIVSGDGEDDYHGIRLLEEQN